MIIASSIIVTIYFSASKLSLITYGIFGCPQAVFETALWRVRVSFVELMIKIKVSTFSWTLLFSRHDGKKNDHRQTQKVLGLIFCPVSTAEYQCMCNKQEPSNRPSSITGGQGVCKVVSRGRQGL